MTAPLRAGAEGVRITWGMLLRGVISQRLVKRAEKTAHWDLKVEDEGGHSVQWNDLNLLEIAEVTLHLKDGKAWADFK